MVSTAVYQKCKLYQFWPYVDLSVHIEFLIRFSFGRGGFRSFLLHTFRKFMFKKVSVYCLIESSKCLAILSFIKLCNLDHFEGEHWPWNVWPWVWRWVPNFEIWDFFKIIKQQLLNERQIKSHDNFVTDILYSKNNIFLFNFKRIDKFF